MAWSLDPTAPVGAELRRLLDEQGHRAAEALRGPDLDRGVHEARKSSKRARALLRSTEGALPEAARRAELARFRDAARLVAASRDAAVRVATFDLLAAGRWPEVRAELVAAAGEERDPAAVRTAAEAFDREVILPEEVDRERWIGGIAARYRAGRKGMPARATEAPERFHAWRRATKDQLYLLQVLRPLWPAMLDVMASATDALQERLGLHQDLCVLREWLVEHRPSEEELLRKLHRRAAGLRRAALREGARFYALPPRGLEVWLRRLWTAAG